MPGGQDATLGYAAETTYGTSVTPNRFVEFTSEGLQYRREILESQGLNGRRILSRFRLGKARVEGDIELELPNRHVGGLLRATFGTVSTSGTGPYTHTFTLGDLTDRSLTIQVRKPAVGSNPTHTYVGCKVQSWSIEADTDNYVKMTVGIVGRDESTAIAYTTPTYPTGYSPFAWTDCSLTVGGGPVPVKSVKFECANNQADDRYFIQATTPHLMDQPVESGKREITGELVADWNAAGIARYADFKAGTPATLVLTCNQAADSQLIITSNVLYRGETPTVGGPELVEHTTPFQVFHATSDTSAWSVAYITSESTV